MQFPSATYRLQLNPAFGFSRAGEVMAYLAELGISHVYASPVFEARPGSPHGYDVVNPNRIGPELGGEEAFRGLLSRAQGLGLGWIQDIVPNHQAFDGRNPMLAEVLELGRASAFSNYFDICWDEPGLEGRLLAPFLGRSLEECLEAGEIKPGFDREGFHLAYYGLRLPLGPESYPVLFTSPEGGLPASKEAYIRLWEKSREVRDLVRDRLAVLARPAALAGLLAEQRFRLAPWQEAAVRINYRRFFNLNGLICLRQEEPGVFDQTHGLVLDLVRQGLIQGLRVDHLDGLLDPAGYLDRLRKAAGQVYLVVEKILSQEEDLPPEWPIQGTTGYDFAALAGALFRPKENGPEMERIYAEFSGTKDGFEEVLRTNKKRLLETSFPVELERLARLFGRLGQGGPDLKSALAEVLARFPVYRTYGGGQGLSPRDRGLVARVLAQAQEARPDLKPSLELVARVLLAEDEDPDRLLGLGRLEQLSGPLMAKGLEDTTFYQYNLLLSLNEVGSSPAIFSLGREEFHEYIKRRQAAWPGTMNATATHDTKRGEDARTRLNVLAELPGEWAEMIHRWSALNLVHRTGYQGRLVPDRNEEYLLYQTLLAAWPLEEEFNQRLFAGRIKEFFRKALREAKVNSSWLEPREGYEAACLGFVDRVLDPNQAGPFLASFLPFQRKIAALGILSSLSQTLLKLICPGIPDLYQGTELWDLSLADPDNRRPVDFELRRRTLDRLRVRFREEPRELVQELAETRADGRLKLFILHRALRTRRKNQDLFAQGACLPLEISGPLSRHVVALARAHEGKWALGLVPRFLAGLLGRDELPLGRSFWGETRLRPPGKGPRLWRDVLTGREHETKGGLMVGRVLEYLPLSLLMGEEEK